MKNDVAVCPGTLLVTGFWELFQWMSQTPSSDLSLIVTVNLRLRVVCGGTITDVGKNTFLGSLWDPDYCTALHIQELGSFFMLKFLCATPRDGKACSGSSPHLLSL